MGEGQFQDSHASRDTGGFWRTLPGILAAAGTFLAGLAGLAAVIVPNFFGTSSPRHASEQVAKLPSDAPARAADPSPPDTTAPKSMSPRDAPAQTATLSPEAPAPIVKSPPDGLAQGANSTAAEPSQPASDRYVAAYASDGFVVLRSQPTIASAEVTRIFVGIAVRCGKAKWVADGYRWRRCVDQDGQVGYMSDTFLRKG